MLETYVKTRIAVESFVRRQAELATSSEYRWVWLVLIGILVVAAAVAWVYCRNAATAVSPATSRPSAGRGASRSASSSAATDPRSLS
ncbi:MAG: hypothetical protein R2703_14790 [Micropruina glycogenica]